MRFGVLGPLSVVDRGTVLRVGACKQRVALAVLLSEADRVVSVDRLVTALWGDAPPRGGTRTLQVHMHRLRQALGPAARERLVCCPPGYRLSVGPDELDVRVFEDLAAQGRAAFADGEYRRAVELLERALALWRGAPFADLPDVELLRGEAVRLGEHRLAVLEQRIDALLALGRHTEVVPDLFALVADHPLRERFTAQLMVALHRSGRQAEALEVYRRARSLLRDSLGVDPGAELRRAEQSVLAAGAGVRAAAPAPAPARVPVPGDGGGDGGGDRDGGGDGGGDGVRLPAPLPAPAQLPPDLGDFTGRDDTVRLVCEVLNREASVLPVVAVSGRPGVGKTALAVHVAHRLRAEYPDGQLHVNLRGAHPQPLRPEEVLGRFLRALGVHGTAVPDGLDERVALYRSRLACGRVLVLLDDARDEAQVRPLLPGAPQCAVLVTSRRRLAGLSTALSLDLGALRPHDATTLLERAGAGERARREAGTAAEIVGLCGHLPLAVRVAAARLAARPEWTLERFAARVRDERRRLDALAAGDLDVRAGLALAYHGLDDPARRAFRLLGLLDTPHASVWTVAALLDVSLPAAEDVVDALLDARLLDSSGPAGQGQQHYHLHDLTRLYARERALAEDGDRARREALLRAFGAWLALADAANERLGSRFAPLRGGARRWWPAADGAPGASGADGAVAADPRAWFEAELACLVAATLQAAGMDAHELAWELAARVHDVAAVGQHHDEWHASHGAALAAARRAGDRLGQAVILRNLAHLAAVRPALDLGEALRHAEAALALFRALDQPKGVVDALLVCAEAHQLRGDLDRAADRVDEAWQTTLAAGYRSGEVRVAQERAVLERERGNLDEALRHAGHALAAAPAQGPDVSMTLLLVGIVQRDLGRFAEAEASLRRAVRGCRELGDVSLLAQAAANLGLLYVAAGRHGRALAVLDDTLRLATERDLGVVRALALRGLADLDRTRGDHDGAVRRLSEAARIWHAAGWPSGEAAALRSLGQVHRDAGREAAARAAWREARVLCRRLGRVAEVAELDVLLAETDAGPAAPPQGPPPRHRDVSRA